MAAPVRPLPPVPPGPGPMGPGGPGAPPDAAGPGDIDVGPEGGPSITLTPEQQDELRDWFAQHKGGMAPEAGPPPAPAGPPA